MNLDRLAISVSTAYPDGHNWEARIDGKKVAEGYSRKNDRRQAKQDGYSQAVEQLKGEVKA